MDTSHTIPHPSIFNNGIIFFFLRLHGFGAVRPQFVSLVQPSFTCSLYSIQPAVGHSLFNNSSNGTTEASSSTTERAFRLLARTARIPESWVEAS